MNLAVTMIVVPLKNVFKLVQEKPILPVSKANEKGLFDQIYIFDSCCEPSLGNC